MAHQTGAQDEDGETDGSSPEVDENKNSKNI